MLVMRGSKSCDLEPLDQESERTLQRLQGKENNFNQATRPNDLVFGCHNIEFEWE